MTVGLTVAVGVLVFLVITLAVGMVVALHNKFNAQQLELINDARCFYDVGASKIATLLSELACLNVRNAIRRLRGILQQVRSPQDALNLFADMWYRQLDLRLENEGEREKIMKVIAAKLKAEGKSSLIVADHTDTKPSVEMATTAKVS